MNRVIHFEIHAIDPERVIAFYTEVFGWTIQKWENPDFEYWMVLTGSAEEPGINGGIMKRKTPLTGEATEINAYVCTIGVTSVDEYTQKITAAGGSVVVPKMHLTGAGYLVYCKDVDGNLFGIMEPEIKS